MNKEKREDRLALKALRSLFAWLATIAILALVFSRVPFSGAARAVENADFPLVFAAVILSFFAHAALAPAKYMEILKGLGCRLSFTEAIVLRMGTLPVKSVMPFKTGELSIIGYLRKTHDLNLSRGASSIIWGYILSALVCAPVILAGCVLYCSPPVRWIIMAALILFIIAAAAACWLVFKRTSITILVFTAGFEGIKLLNALLVFKALKVDIPAEAFLFFVPLTLLISSLPVTISGLGTREASILIFFRGLSAPETLLGCGLLISLVNSILPAVLGGFFMVPLLKRTFNGGREGSRTC